MLSQEKILKNTKKFFETATAGGYMNDELMALLGEDFIKAPASTSKNFNNSFEGGLIDHILTVTSFAVSINELFKEKQQSKASLVKVCLLHQIGAAHIFNKAVSGYGYEFNNSLITLRVGERSVQYLNRCGISLSEDEYQAILNFDKDDSDKQAKIFTKPLGKILKAAIEMAIIKEKE